VQSALPSALLETPKEFYEKTNKQLQTHALYLTDRLSKIPGLNPVKPGGTMYLMVRKFPEISC
jgi:aspartate/methionine/tyrosine aminotransferase